MPFTREFTHNASFNNLVATKSESFWDWYDRTADRARSALFSEPYFTEEEIKSLDKEAQDIYFPVWLERCSVALDTIYQSKGYDLTLLPGKPTQDQQATEERILLEHTSEQKGKAPAYNEQSGVTEAVKDAPCNTTANDSHALVGLSTDGMVLGSSYKCKSNSALRGNAPIWEPGNMPDFVIPSKTRKALEIKDPHQQSTSPSNDSPVQGLGPISDSPVQGLGPISFSPVQGLGPISFSPVLGLVPNADFLDIKVPVDTDIQPRPAKRPKLSPRIPSTTATPRMRRKSKAPSLTASLKQARTRNRVSKRLSPSALARLLDAKNRFCEAIRKICASCPWFKWLEPPPSKEGSKNPVQPKAPQPGNQELAPRQEGQDPSASTSSPDAPRLRIKFKKSPDCANAPRLRLESRESPDDVDPGSPLPSSGRWFFTSNSEWILLPDPTPGAEWTNADTDRYLWLHVQNRPVPAAATQQPTALRTRIPFSGRNPSRRSPPSAFPPRDGYAANSMWNPDLRQRSTLPPAFANQPRRTWSTAATYGGRGSDRHPSPRSSGPLSPRSLPTSTDLYGFSPRAWFGQ